MPTSKRASDGHVEEVLPQVAPTVESALHEQFAPAPPLRRPNANGRRRLEEAAVRRGVLVDLHHFAARPEARLQDRRLPTRLGAEEHDAGVGWNAQPDERRCLARES